jgi:hypothetical protein
MRFVCSRFYPNLLIAHRYAGAQARYRREAPSDRFPALDELAMAIGAVAEDIERLVQASVP